MHPDSVHSDFGAINHLLTYLLTYNYCISVCFLSSWCFGIWMQQVVLLQEAKSNLLAEVERLNDRLNQSEVLDDPK